MYKCSVCGYRVWEEDTFGFGGPLCERCFHSEWQWGQESHPEDREDVDPEEWD